MAVFDNGRVEAVGRGGVVGLSHCGIEDFAYAKCYQMHTTDSDEVQVGSVSCHSDLTQLCRDLDQRFRMMARMIRSRGKGYRQLVLLPNCEVM